MDTLGIVHVAVAPPDTVDLDLIRAVAGIVNKDLSETRLLLVGKVPRIVAHCHGEQAAGSVARSLRALGLVTVVCGDRELRQPSRSFRACTSEFGREGVVFHARDGQLKTVGAKSVLLIHVGRIQSYTEKQAVSTRVKFSLPGTVLTGGIPVFRKVKEKTTELSAESECFVRCYDQLSPESCVEVSQHDFDYSCLGTKMVSSSYVNLNTVVAELRRTFTSAVFDDRLMQPFRVDMPSTTQRENIEIVCKLVFFHHRATGTLGASD